MKIISLVYKIVLLLLLYHFLMIILIENALGVMRLVMHALDLFLLIIVLLVLLLLEIYSTLIEFNLLVLRIVQLVCGPTLVLEHVLLALKDA